MKDKNVYFGFCYSSFFPEEPRTHLQQHELPYVPPSVLLKEKWNSNMPRVCVPSLGTITTVSHHRDVCLSKRLPEWFSVLSLTHFLHDKQSTQIFLLGQGCFGACLSLTVTILEEL